MCVNKAEQVSQKLRNVMLLKNVVRELNRKENQQKDNTGNKWNQKDT